MITQLSQSQTVTDQPAQRQTPHDQPLVSVVITAYNAAHDLPPCLDSLFTQDYPNFEVIVVDNASTDETPTLLESYQDRIRLVTLPVNRAITGGYNAGAAVAEGEILIFINADTMAQPGWLRELVRPIREESNVGMSTSRILLYDAPHLINTCGNDLTWTGLTVCRGFNESAERWQMPDDVVAVSGAACAVRRSLFETIGGFDETFEFYLDDTDLSLRGHLAGYRIRFAPDSRILHRYTFKFSASKVFYLERNRWLTMLKALHLPTLILLLPGLLLGEAMAWVYSAMQGPAHLRAKLAAWRWIWTNRNKVRELHRQTQAFRKVSDAHLLAVLSPEIRFTGTVPDKIARVMESVTQPLLIGYGRLCRLIAIW